MSLVGRLDSSIARPHRNRGSELGEAWWHWRQGLGRVAPVRTSARSVMDHRRRPHGASCHVIRMRKGSNGLRAGSTTGMRWEDKKVMLHSSPRLMHAWWETFRETFFNSGAHALVMRACSLSRLESAAKKEARRATLSKAFRSHSR